MAKFTILISLFELFIFKNQTIMVKGLDRVLDIIKVKYHNLKHEFLTKHGNPIDRDRLHFELTICETISF